MSFENASAPDGLSWSILNCKVQIGSEAHQKHWMRELTKNITEGRAVLLDGIQEEIEATLDPLLARAIVKKAGSYSL